MLRYILQGFITISIVFLSAVVSLAQNESAPEQEEWNPVSAGPITTWTAPLCGKGKFVVQPFFFYNRTRGSFNSEGHYDSLAKGDKKYQYQQQLFMQYGLTDRLEIDAQVIYQENFRKQGNLKAHSDGLGDSYLFFRYCAIEEKGWIPHLDGLLQLKFPTGKYQHADPDKLGTDLMGSGSYDYGFGINLTKKIKPFILHADAIYSFPQEVKVDGTETKYAEYLNYDFGAEYFLPKGFNLMLEVNGFLQGDKKENTSHTPDSDVRCLTMSAGIGWSCDKIQALLAYQRTISGANTDANDSVAITAVYTF
jgi:hypothetical protein